MKTYFFFFVLLLLYSCKNPSILEKKGKATFIISNDNRVITNIGTGIDIKSLDRLNMNTDKKKDTIQVFVNKYRKVYLKNANTFKSIICEKEDTVYLDICKNDMGINYKNKTLKKYDTLPLTFLYSRYLKREISVAKSFRAKFLKEDEWTKKISFNQKFLDSNRNGLSDYHLMLKNITSKSNKILLKLLKQDSISLPNYNYHKSKNNYKEFSTLLEAFNYSEDIYLKYQIFKYFESNDVIMDEFMAYGYLNRLLNDIYIKKYKYDFIETFDSLPSHISGNTLKYAQLICLKEIASNYNYKTYELYAKKYLNEANDFKKMQSVVKAIGENYALKSNFLGEKKFKDLWVKTVKGDKISFAEILKKNSNKVVYIDFWASWCVPCRASMTGSRKLHDDYINKDISFIYVSIDKDFEKWNKASEIEGLSNSNNNLLAVNFPSASIYRELDLKSIPRYLLFSKKGELYHWNAPGPDSEKTRILIDKLLTL